MVSLLDIYIHHNRLEEIFNELMGGAIDINEGLVAYAIKMEVRRMEDISQYIGMEMEELSVIIESLVSKELISLEGDGYILSEKGIELLSKVEGIDVPKL